MVQLGRSHCYCTGKDQKTFGDCRSNSAAVTSQGYEAVEEPAWVVVELKQPKVFRIGSFIFTSNSPWH